MRRKIINRENPRLRVVMDWGSSRPLGMIALFVRRVGDVADFAAYPPIEENGSELLFQFDELLFVRRQGRYVGRLLVGATHFVDIELEYRDRVQVLAVENQANV